MILRIRLKLYIRLKSVKLSHPRKDYKTMLVVIKRS